jgi:hypothetical protein
MFSKNMGLSWTTHSDFIFQQWLVYLKFELSLHREAVKKYQKLIP